MPWRRVVRLNWFVLPTSCTIRGRSTSSKGGHERLHPEARDRTRRAARLTPAAAVCRCPRLVLLGARPRPRSSATPSSKRSESETRSDVARRVGRERDDVDLGQADCRTTSRSAGLSSTKTSESRPMFEFSRDRPQARRLVVPVGEKGGEVVESQRISGCCSNGSRASAALFLTHTASMTPRDLREIRYSWNAMNASPCGPPPSWIPPGPPRRSRRPRVCCRGRGPSTSS